MDDELARTIAVLRSGGVVAFPTDTVWGVMAQMENASACMRLYALKGRPEDVPLPILVADEEAALALAELGPLEGRFRALIRVFWPGALTVVVPGRRIPAWISKDGSVGLRWPAHVGLYDVLSALGGHAAATSLNRSGKPPVRSYAEALTFAVDRVHPGEDPPGTSSTVVDLMRGVVVREGAIPGGALASWLGEPSR
jgi:L-threonylcarbamoyladenylate synthase